MIARELIRYKPAADLSSPEARYSGQHPGTTLLSAGYRHVKGALALPCDITWERDVPLVMRDGTTIFADVYRPTRSSSVPAIVNWAPYGKGGTGYHHLSKYPRRMGIAEGRLSELQSWEGNDPAYWCNHGYAVVQVDARGAFDSEGDIHALGEAEGRDGHDAIEAIAALPWCTGRIGMAGNSYLACAQWFVAAQRPEHLAAIAPWEGGFDAYRQMIGRGGIPRITFATLISATLYGHRQLEDVLGMLTERPIFDEYWEEKSARVSDIEVPAYVTASFTNQLHAEGTIRGWANLTGPKWLRVHNTMEWPDFYDELHVEDLRRFFDRYLLDKQNGWEATPPVRISVLDPGHRDTVDRAVDAFPPAGTTNRVLYLDASTGRLGPNPPEAMASSGYELRGDEPWVDFVYRFDRDTEVIGWPMATLWVSSVDHSDADIYVYLQKLNRRGREQWHQMIDLGLPLARRWMPLLRRLGVSSLAPSFYTGVDGSVRASLRGLDPATDPAHPDLLLKEHRPLTPGVPVEIELPLCPMGMRWHAGEQLRMRIAGKNLLPPAVPGLPPEPLQAGTRHLVHTGGAHLSTLTLPIAPPTR